MNTQEQTALAARKRGYEYVRDMMNGNSPLAAGELCAYEYAGKCDGVAIVREYDGAPVCASCEIAFMWECQEQWQTVSEYAAGDALLFPANMPNDEAAALEKLLARELIAGVRGCLTALATMTQRAECVECCEPVAYDVNAGEWRHIAPRANCYEWVRMGDLFTHADDYNNNNGGN